MGIVPLWDLRQVNNGSLERFILLQMLGQRVAMAKVMVGFEEPIPPPFPIAP